MASEKQQQAVTKAEMAAKLKHLDSEAERLSMVVQRGEESRFIEVDKKAILPLVNWRRNPPGAS